MTREEAAAVETSLFVHIEKRNFHRLIQIARPLAIAWDRGMIEEIPDWESLCQSANELLRELGEIE